MHPDKKSQKPPRITRIIGIFDGLSDTQDKWPRRQRWKYLIRVIRVIRGGV
jgi:hypothetical protein